ncbi:MAG: hypothetical protein LBT46_06870 [Planctomycetaceae bacterium]|nr:hypothetical protein [Planctomycetaceae bacterium]
MLDYCKSGQDEQTIRSYFLRYKESGEYGLVQMNYSGKEPFLTRRKPVSPLALIPIILPIIPSCIE